jgi:hypothetical protein
MSGAWKHKNELPGSMKDGGMIISFTLQDAALIFGYMDMGTGSSSI